MHTLASLTRLTVFALLVLTLAAQADDRFVSPSGGNTPPFTSWTDAATSIQDAVDACSAGDVVWVTNGTYTLNGQITVATAITLRSVNGSATTAINGNYPTVESRCLNVSAAAVIQGFTITNGYAQNQSPDDGAGLYITTGATVRDCIIADNEASYGGGIYMSGVSTVTNCTFARNRASMGAGAYMNAAGLFTHSTFTSNYADLVYQRGGGMMVNYGTVEKCVFTHNTGDEGAGVRVLQSAAMVRNCLIAHNTGIAISRGGGVELLNGKLINCTIVSNSAVTAGGVYFDDTSAYIRNCIITDNRAPSYPNIQLVLGTVENTCTQPLIPDGANAADNIDALPEFVDPASGNYHLHVGSPCVDTGTATDAPADDLDGNARPVDGDADGSTVVDMGCYESAASTGGTYRCNLIADPVAGVAPQEGGFTAAVGGPATNGTQTRWDFGDGHNQAWSSSLLATNTYTTGVFSVTLTVSNALSEVVTLTRTNYVTVTPPTLYVAPGGSDTYPYDTWAKATHAIQDAIAVPGAAQVVVSNGVYALTNPVMITSDMTVRSLNGPAVTALNGQYPAHNTRGVFINSAGALFAGFTVSNTYATESGAGIYMAVGTVSNCVLSGNTTTVHGGGLYADGASLVRDTLMADNQANYGGGLYVAGAVTVTNCTLTRNRATQGAGAYMGGIGLVTHCAFTNNFGDIGWRRGGGIMVGNGVVRNSTFLHNTGDEGSGVRLARNSSVVENCLIAYNTGLDGSRGGGVELLNGTLLHCTVVSNTAVTGGGVWLNDDPTAYIRNGIVYNNDAPTGPNVHVQGTVNGHVSYSCTTPQIPDGDHGTANIADAPQFVGFAAGNFHLAVGSPCIDTADTSIAPNTDLDDNPRPVDGDGDETILADMGAYESQGLASGDFRCNFVGDPVSGFDTQQVVFTASLAGPYTNGTQTRWDFGDGHNKAWSSSLLATNAYGPGTFTVTLTVSNDMDQTDTLAKTNYITVSPSTLYVSPAGSDTFPYDTWDKAAHSILDAVAVPGGTRVLVSNGVYTLTNEISLTRDIALLSLNGAAVTILDGGYPARSNRCVTLNAGNAVLDGFTISNAYQTGASPEYNGGGVLLSAGQVVNCAIRNNRADGNGGGMYMAAGTVATNCDISGNRAGFAGGNLSGGGAYVTGATLTDSRVWANGFRSSGIQSGYGGGLTCNSSIISNCVIYCNTNAYRGGGLQFYWSLLKDCTISGNYGGLGGAYYSSAGMVENCVLSNNYAVSYGGGAYMRREECTLRNSLVVGNESGSYGGGIAIDEEGGERIQNCTVAGNSAGTAGGGVWIDSVLGANAPTDVFVTNTIVYFNQAAAAADDIWGLTPAVAYSCSPDLTDGISGNRTGDPRFLDEGSGYGLAHAPGNYQLHYSSPCYDTGTNATWMIGAYDLAGNPRILPETAGTVNMGAYELVQPSLGTLFTIH